MYLFYIRCISLYSYIKPQPGHRQGRSRRGCISLYSYIKPQLTCCFISYFYVVYLYIPTSNHNALDLVKHDSLLYIFIFLHQTTTSLQGKGDSQQLYIFIFLHQTTTTSCKTKKVIQLYIFIFLHQTTTALSASMLTLSCISLYSYIKPQQGTGS